MSRGAPIGLLKCYVIGAHNLFRRYQSLLSYYTHAASYVINEMDYSRLQVWTALAVDSINVEGLEGLGGCIFYYLREIAIYSDKSHAT